MFYNLRFYQIVVNQIFENNNTKKRKFFCRFTHVLKLLFLYLLIKNNHYFLLNK